MSIDRKNNDGKIKNKQVKASYADFPNIINSDSENDFFALKKSADLMDDTNEYAVGEYPSLYPVDSEEQIFVPNNQFIKNGNNFSDYNDQGRSNTGFDVNTPNFVDENLQSDHWNNNSANPDTYYNNVQPFISNENATEEEQFYYQDERYYASPTNKNSSHEENFLEQDNFFQNLDNELRRFSEQSTFNPVDEHLSFSNSQTRHELNMSNKRDDEDVNYQNQDFASLDHSTPTKRAGGSDSNFGNFSDQDASVQPVSFSAGDYNNIQISNKQAKQQTTNRQNTKRSATQDSLFPWSKPGQENDSTQNENSSSVNHAVNSNNTGSLSNHDILKNNQFNSNNTDPASTQKKNNYYSSKDNFIQGYGSYTTRFGSSSGAKSRLERKSQNSINSFQELYSANTKNTQPDTTPVEPIPSVTALKNNEQINPYIPATNNTKSAQVFGNLEEEQLSFAEDFAKLDADTHKMDLMVDDFALNSSSKTNQRLEPKVNNDRQDFSWDEIAGSTYGNNQYQSYGNDQDSFEIGSANDPISNEFSSDDFSQNIDKNLADEVYDNGLYNWAAPGIDPVSSDFEQLDKKKGKGKKVVLSIILVILLAIICGVAYWFYVNKYNEISGDPLVVHKPAGDYKVQPEAQPSTNDNQEQSVTDGLNNSDTDKSQQKSLIDKSENPMDMQYPGGASPFSNSNTFDQSSVEPLIKMAIARATPARIVPVATIDASRHISFPEHQAAQTKLVAHTNETTNGNASSTSASSSVTKEQNSAHPATQNKSATEDMPTTSDSGFYVQISSQPSKEAAEKSIQNAKAHFIPELANRLKIVSANIPGKGTYYRVRLPAQTREEANRLCNDYKKDGNSCFVGK